ncbi:hypothetical protein LV89_00388 [Arcicella aurantiaca]|uniref:Uncharacterized protein n=1 Tax=Arcicella aurantiaca TaxID=591202 RepID=A0A316EH83_9BACT|nr:hypothetical protein [Arcicella aurantiaca]PWK28835.1 hypothetical protein LV89_00388 [Arcicella aurantiaca]
METIQKNTSINAKNFIKQWKERKKQNEQESKEFALTPEFQELKNRLREKKAKKGIVIPRI